MSKTKPTNNELTEENVIPETPVIPQTTPEPKRYVYIGPTVIRTELIAGRVFICDGVSIEECLASTFEKFPEARRLVVPCEEANVCIKKIRDGGNSLAVAYKTLMKIKIGG